MSDLVERWHGGKWMALVTREPYGLHFSVSARGRPPTDEEVQRARDAYPGILPSAEFTDWWRAHGQVNPYVRHFAHPDHVAGLPK